ncbi:unnamed protein product [Pseudo-nitzschia multistriata]|uniref:Large ribosomal subunit protein uL29m n=1 Tax=Pseudo-nitzschia multistriata TaxID=183589 RepID=A0A448Z5R2_9STRA|nr:unnamed protein product [Pseudo-nitzschia multistriata]
MAYRSMQHLTRRGFGLTAGSFRAVTKAPVVGNAVAAAPHAHVGFSENRTGHSSPLRSYSSTRTTSKREYKPNPLDAFRDPVDRSTRMEQTVGRQWSAKELRRKSYEDLHRLWYVLYKEKNMLLTEQQLSRRRQLIFPQPERFKKVQKSMGAIRQVLGERKRETVAAHLARHEEKELAKQMTDELDGQDTYEAIDETSK